MIISQEIFSHCSQTIAHFLFLHFNFKISHKRSVLANNFIHPPMALREVRTCEKELLRMVLLQRGVCTNMQIWGCGGGRKKQKICFSFCSLQDEVCSSQTFLWIC